MALAKAMSSTYGETLSFTMSKANGFAL